MRSHRTLAVLAGLPLAMAAALFPATGASGAADPPGGVLRGGPCYGPRCDGQDPRVTGCDKGAFTASADGTPARVAAFGGFVELRYGPGEVINGRRTCRVNWARFVKQGQGDGYNVWVERKSSTSDKKLTQYSGGDEGTGIIYSDQVFAPDGVLARACVHPVIRSGQVGRVLGVCTGYV